MKSKSFKKTLLIITLLTLTFAAGCGAKSVESNQEGSNTKSESNTGSGGETTAAGTGNTGGDTAQDTSQDTVQDTASDESSGDVQTITIGINNSYNPMCYLDENGEMQGYDYETLLKIDELLPQYEFKFEPTEFPNLLVGLDTKTYDIAVCHFGWNKERAEKYLYAQVGNFYFTGYNLIIAKGSKIAVNSVDDLGGLTLCVGTSSNVAYLCENYNKEHPDNQINLVYDDGTQEQHLASIQSGVYDGFFGDPFNDSLLKKAFGDTFDVTGANLFYDDSIPNGTYFIYNYGDEKLRDDIDGALQELLDNGWQSELSIKLLGDDYTIKIGE